MSTEIRDDIVAEAERMAAAIAERGVPVRLIGGLAVRLHAPSGLPPALRREYQDIDLVTTGKGAKATLELLESLGYTPNDRFNAMNAGRRALVYDLPHQRQVDVFVEEFRMCHRIPLGDRMLEDRPSIPLAELLLTKLQVVQLNRKDLVDIAAILCEHEVGDGDEETINAARVAKVLAADWGLWRTSRGTVETVRGHLPELGLDAQLTATIDARLEAIWSRVEAEPKSLRWKARARVGERTSWYEMPEEIAG
jgi:hypothetical protein